MEDVKEVQKDIKKEKGSNLIYNDLLSTDLSIIDDIPQLIKMKSKVKGNITFASNLMSEITEGIKLVKNAKSVTKKVIEELKDHDRYQTILKKKTVNEAKLAEIEQRIQELKGQGKGQVGGADPSARDRYYLTQGIQGINSYGQPSAAFQQPYLQQQPMSYGQRQPLYPSLNPFQRQRPYGQRPIPYGQQLINPLDQITYAKQMSYYNKALELESKLAFYVNVELTLFPGTSVNSLQKASALCSARFEDIRKAFTEIVGLEYRPRPLVDNSNYNKDKENNKNKELEKDKKRGGSIKNRKLKKNNTIRIKYKN